MRFTILIVTLLVVPFLLVACGERYVGATETGNTKVTGVVGGTVGSAGRVRVEIVPAGYNPLEDVSVLPADTTVVGGEYGFVVRADSTYNIVGVNLETGERFLIRNIVAEGDSIRVPVGALAPHGGVKVVLGDLDSLRGAGIYLAGTPFFVRVDSTAISQGYLVLDSVPAGLLPGLLLSPAEGASIQLVDEDVLVVSSGRVSLANADGAWRHSRRLYLNTSPTGADVPETVHGFPLLVRLDATYLDFAEARKSGQDLRFAKPNGSSLPHEISRWDSAAGLAEIWVKVDTILGNVDSQYIEMFWGNGQADSRAYGNGVFDTANGFVSVWHLDATPISNPTRYEDATAHGFHGTGMNLTASAGVPGMVGIAQRFNGTDSYINIPGSAGGSLNFPQRSTYTVSAWVRADSLPSRYQTLVGKGDNQFNLQISRENMWHFVEAQQSGQFEAVEVPAQTGVWRLLTGVRDGAGIALYVDGVLVDNQLVIKAETANRSESNNVSIGWNNEVSGQAFAGTLDEVVLANRPRSPAWIKLTFENQKRGQSLVRPADLSLR